MPDLKIQHIGTYCIFTTPQDAKEHSKRLGYSPGQLSSYRFES